MDLTEKEYKTAKKTVETWEKFASQWPKMRWVALCVLILPLIATFMGYQAVEKMERHNQHATLLGADVAPKHIGVYVDARMDLLRTENRFYINSIISCITATMIFLSLFLGWNRHRHINVKIKIYRDFLKNNPSQTGS